MADRDIELRLTADDQASKVIGDVAGELEQLDDPAEVTVTADTQQAERDIDQFARSVDDLTGDALELRIDVREDRLKAKIEGLERQLDRLTDPVDIEVTTAELEQAEQDLRDLQKFAGRDIDVAVDVDTSSARQASDDLNRMNASAEGIQRGIGPLRGFTDELGGSSQQAGVFANAIIDGGEAIEVFGSQMGFSEGALGKLSLGIGAAGLALGALTLAWQKAGEAGRKNAEFDAASVEAYGEAIADLGAGVDAIVQKITDAGKVELILPWGDVSDVTDQLTAAGLTVESFAELVKRGQPAITAWGEAQVAAGVSSEAVGAAMLAAGREAQNYAESADAAARTAAFLGDSNDDAASASESLAEQQEAIADKAEAAAEKLNASAEAANAVAAANRDAAGAGVEYAAAQDQWATSLAESNTALAEAGEGTAAYRDVLRQSTDEAVSMADAAVSLADAQARANGETLSGSEATSTWNREMVGAARTAEGPLRQSIINYIATVNGIPPEKVSEILANTNYATVEEAQAALDNASAARQSQITAEAQTAQADEELNSVADKQRTAQIDVVTRGIEEAIGNIQRVIGWGGRTTVNVNMSRAATGRDLDRTAARWARLNGH